MRSAAAVMALALLVLPGVASCLHVDRPIEAPRVELRGVAREPGGDGSLVLRLELAVINPNDAALDLRAVDWQLALDDGRAIARGRADVQAHLAAHASTAVSAAVHLSAAQSARLGSSAFQLSGTLHCFAGAIGVAADFFGDGVS